MRSDQIIHSEHRSMFAVIHALEYLAERLGSRDATPDFRLLNAILYYVREYPERLHHPTEDRVLFARIRARTTEAEQSARGARRASMRAARRASTRSRRH
jgi:hemerythrin-like domain-containing protein